MRIRSAGSIALALGMSALLGGCGGGGHTSVLSNSPTSPNGPTLQSGARLVLTGSVDGTGPQFLAHVRRLPTTSLHRLLTLKSVTVAASLYPGDHANTVITNAVVITTSSVPATASVSLSNVPVGNNEFVLMQFTGNATDGSQVALGELGGLVNVTSSTTNTATLTEATSRTFQVFLDLADSGALSTDDLDTASTLAATLTTDIGAAPFDATTHLFNAGELQTLYNSIAPKFQRNVTITASPATNGSYVLERDYTNASELDLTSNLESFLGGFILSIPILSTGNVIGGGTGEGGFSVATPVHTQLTAPPPVPLVVNAFVTGGLGTQTVRNVYGGHMLVGATNNVYSFEVPLTPPYSFTGGWLSLAGRAPGTATATVTTKATLQSIKVSDPAGYAFGAQFFASGLNGGLYTQPNFGTAALSATQFNLFASAGASRVGIPVPYSSTSTTVSVDTFNPWNIATTDMDLCGGVTCFLLGATPVAIVRPFADAGTKLTYFAWKPSGKASAITQVSGGYNVTVTGAGTATLTSSTASALLPRQTIVISSTDFSPTTWTFSATDASANIYSGSATGLGGSATITMNSVGTEVATKTETISWTTLSSGTVEINSIASQ